MGLTQASVHLKKTIPTQTTPNTSSVHIEHMSITVPFDWIVANETPFVIMTD